MMEFEKMDRPHKGDSDNEGPYSDDCQILDVDSDNHSISSNSIRSVKRGSKANVFLNFLGLTTTTISIFTARSASCKFDFSL